MKPTSTTALQMLFLMPSLLHNESVTSATLALPRWGQQGKPVDRQALSACSLGLWVRSSWPVNWRVVEERLRARDLTMSYRLKPLAFLIAAVALLLLLNGVFPRSILSRS